MATAPFLSHLRVVRRRTSLACPQLGFAVKAMKNAGSRSLVRGCARSARTTRLDGVGGVSVTRRPRTADMPRSPNSTRSYDLEVSDSSSRFRRDGFVTVLSAEEQKAVYIPIELVRPDHIILGRPPEIGWLSGMNEVAELRAELDTLWHEADTQQRAVIEEAADLVDYSLEGGRAFIAVFRGEGAGD
jgi:hypothetical protein